MTPETALQIGVRARLVDTSAVTALVPATAILDRNERPVPNPSIVIGEKTAGMGSGLARRMTDISLDLHVWKKEPSTEGVTEIAGEIRNAIHSARLVLAAGFHCVDAHVGVVRVLRDPDGVTSHAVVTVIATVEDVS